MIRALFPTFAGARDSLRADVPAGFSLAAVALPGSMAAAQLAGVSPTQGLLGFIIGAVVFALLGGHRTLSVGPDSSIAPTLAAGAVAVGAGTLDAGALALMSVLVGVLLLVVGLLRGGWITQFLSRPVIIGLLAGIALNIIASQLPVVLGVGVH